MYRNLIFKSTYTVNSEEKTDFITNAGKAIYRLSRWKEKRRKKREKKKEKHTEGEKGRREVEEMKK